jgi:Asp-tRNA(Asn)/Glu-tRNA(Gln) amidotransferase C subunit
VRSKWAHCYPNSDNIDQNPLLFCILQPPLPSSHTNDDLLSSLFSMSKPLPIRRALQGTDWRKPWAPHPPQPSIIPAIAQLLSKPTWSVRSLRPPPLTTPNESADPAASNSPPRIQDTEITREKLHHLLRLSALPLPKDEKEETSLLQTLREQVHFLSAIRAVDTTDVEPLISIRDETDEGIQARTIGLDDLRPWLELESVDRNGTVRRKKVEREKVAVDANGKREERLKHGAMEWDAFLNKMDEEGVRHTRRNRAGNWFVVKKAKKVEEKAASKVAETTEAGTTEDPASTTSGPTMIDQPATTTEIKVASNIPQPPAQASASVYETLTDLPSQWHRPRPKPKADLPRVGSPLQTTPRVQRPRGEFDLPVDPTRHR